MGTSHTLRRSVAGDWRQGKICFHRGEVMTLFHLRARRAVFACVARFGPNKDELKFRAHDVNNTNTGIKSSCLIRCRPPPPTPPPFSLKFISISPTSAPLSGPSDLSMPPLPRSAVCGHHVACVRIYSRVFVFLFVFFFSYVSRVTSTGRGEQKGGELLCP